MAKENNPDFFSCLHCGTPEENLHHKVTSSAKHMLACPCGIFTKLCDNKFELQEVWNSTPNKPWTRPEVTVTHPDPRGSETMSEAEKKDVF